MLDHTQHFSHKWLQTSPVRFHNEHFGDREDEVTSVQVPENLVCRVGSGDDAAKWHSYDLPGSQPHHNFQTIHLGARMSMDSSVFEGVYIRPHCQGSAIMDRLAGVVKAYRSRVPPSKQNHPYAVISSRATSGRCHAEFVSEIKHLIASTDSPG